MPDSAGGLVRVEPTAGQLVRQRYDRAARVYDPLSWWIERGASRWRRELWAPIDEGRVLEVGIGTGTSLVCHPPRADVTAIDLSPGMLERAALRAARLGSRTRLEVADVQALPYASGSFDFAVATFVFCSVPDPARGLHELLRVLRPGGKLLLVEHVLSERPVWRALSRLVAPIPRRLLGCHFTRDTVSTVAGAGFQLERVTDLWVDIVKHIVAAKPAETPRLGPGTR